MKNAFPDHVEECDLDYEGILRSGGENYGDEDFAVFGCPHCKQIYLLEYEADTVYLDPADLTKRVPVHSDSFTCSNCRKRVPNDCPWIGDRAPREFQVVYDDMRCSQWSWILNDRRNNRAEQADGPDH